jgi:lysophospholipase L1-like esterase
MKKILTISFIAAALIACRKTDFTPASVSPGTANFTTYVAVGNSLTEGYMDDGLSVYGQSHSYPATLAKQMKLADPSMAFLQPMVTGNGSGYIHLAYVNGQIDPIQATDSTYVNPTGPDPSWANWGTTLQGTFVNNMGISGIRLTDCVSDGGLEKSINWVVCSQNPFGRFMNFGNLGVPIQYIDHIRASKATFFTCWLGDNDVLGYALNGGVSSTPFPGVTIDNITTPAEFAQKYDSVLTAFHNLGAQGVCMTIPNVTSIPYFNTVPTFVLVNGVRKYFYIQTGNGSVRLATDNDYILLPAYDSVTAGCGTTIGRPIPNDLVLDAAEADSVAVATVAYNTSIKSLAAQFGFGVVDMYTYLQGFQTSETIDGISFSRTFIQGGTFGLDGIHPTARGYADVANQIILEINSKYGATIPQVDITKYNAEIFPNF